MNGRNPAYRRVNEQTLVKVEDEGIRFFTFWKNVHQQFTVSKGTIYGATYKVEESEIIGREEGNNFYRQLRHEGWVKIEDSDIAHMTEWLGTVLF